MRPNRSLAPLAGVLLAAALAATGVTPPAAADEGTGSTSVAPKPKATAAETWAGVSLPLSVHRGLRWLIINQQPDGGWGQEGVQRAAARAGARSDSDVGNTALAMLALLGEGSRPNQGVFQGPLQRGADYLLRQYDKHGGKGLAFGRKGNTQLRGKIGRYADTFIAARVLVEIDGHMANAADNRRVRAALIDVLRAMEKHQARDGSWNLAVSWAPIHGTAFASQALHRAKQRGHKVDAGVLAKVDHFTVRQLREQARAARQPPVPTGRRGRPPVVTDGGGTDLGPVTVGSGGIQLYSFSQALEQFTRSAASRMRYADEIAQIQKKVSDERVMQGFGSMGGEEFISYTNIAVGMARIDSKDARAWIARTNTAMEKLQNKDGSWSGHHCITGRTAVTALAVQTLLGERQVPRTARTPR